MIAVHVFLSPALADIVRAVMLLFSTVYASISVDLNGRMDH